MLQALREPAPGWGSSPIPVTSGQRSGLSPTAAFPIPSPPGATLGREWPTAPAPRQVAPAEILAAVPRAASRARRASASPFAPATCRAQVTLAHAPLMGHGASDRRLAAVTASRSRL